ncbi:MAG: hypothetical protein CM1200mP18_16270 [Gammaproteobacteria bacterium]|nr:MAG: hypothetical protein CM1200mP18_16270 [Gammaproteobacteria bacterium]
MLESVGRLTGVPWEKQGPAFLVGLGHGPRIGWPPFSTCCFHLLPRILVCLTDAGLLVSIFPPKFAGRKFR